jgi:hypothetical protein
MRAAPLPRVSDRRPHRAPLAAFADGPVADTAEPVAAEAGRPIPEPDRDDTHTVGHDGSMRA